MTMKKSKTKSRKILPAMARNDREAVSETVSPGIYAFFLCPQAVMGNNSIGELYNQW
jgi:hypothetical protein